MGYTTDAKNDSLDGMVGTAVWIVPCDGDPGTTGANVVAGMSPDETTWGAPVAGVKTGTQCFWPAAPAEAYTHYAAFEDALMTTFRFGFALDPPITLGGVGELYITPRVVFA